MADLTIVRQLRGLILSAHDLRNLSNWPSALIEDYLTIFNNLSFLASTIDSNYPEEHSIEYTDFTANVATITHERDRQYVSVTIYDDDDNLVSADINCISDTQFTITVGGAFAGTWNLVII